MQIIIIQVISCENAEIKERQGEKCDERHTLHVGELPRKWIKIRKFCLFTCHKILNKAY